MNFETTGEGFQYLIKNQTSDVVQEKKANNNLSDYAQMIKRNSSLEEYNFRSDITAVKGHKRSSQDAKNIPVYLKNNLNKWEENGNTSPSNTRSKLAKDKLKKLTTQIGSGASRNNTNKGVLSTSLVSKGSKKGGKISPNYMTQGVGSYYLKGKNCSILSNMIKDGTNSTKNKKSLMKGSQEYKSSRRSSNLSEFEKEKNSKIRMMSISNANLFLPNKFVNSVINDTYTPGKKKENVASKLQMYKNFKTVSINDCNDVLSTTTDKRTTDERIEGSFRTLQNKTAHNTESQRDTQERKTLQQIEERLEREYKFYQVKTGAKDQPQEKVPEILLREAADETIKRLAKIAIQYTNILMKIKDCYSNCIKTAIAESDLKTKEIKKLKKEIGDLKLKNDEIQRDNDVKDKTVHEINKELLKLKKSKKESDK